MPDTRRKKGASHAQEDQAETQAPAQADVQVLSKVQIHSHTGLSGYERARMCDALRALWREHGLRGSITVTLDGKALL